MDNTVTIYRDGDVTRVNLRHSKGCLNCSTSLTPDEVREAIKGIDLPTSRERAAARKKAIEAATANA